MRHVGNGGAAAMNRHPSRHAKLRWLELARRTRQRRQRRLPLLGAAALQLVAASLCYCDAGVAPTGCNKLSCLLGGAGESWGSQQCRWASGEPAAVGKSDLDSVDCAKARYDLLLGASARCAMMHHLQLPDCSQYIVLNTISLIFKRQGAQRGQPENRQFRAAAQSSFPSLPSLTRSGGASGGTTRRRASRHAPVLQGRWRQRRRAARERAGGRAAGAGG